MGLLDKLFNREIKSTPVEQASVQQGTIDHTEEAFHMIVEDVFTITGRGTVVTGRIDTGVINNGDTININGALSTRVLGIEMFRKSLDMAQAGDACGLLLENVTRDEVNRGDILTK